MNVMKMRAMKVIKKLFSQYFVSVPQKQKNCFPCVNLCHHGEFASMVPKIVLAIDYGDVQILSWPWYHMSKVRVQHLAMVVDKISKLIEDVMDEFLPHESHGSLWKKLCDHYVKVVDPVTKEFGEENVDDDILHRMKNMLFKFHRGRVVQNGEGIGILSAQSIGETSTQLSVNIFIP